MVQQCFATDGKKRMSACVSSAPIPSAAVRRINPLLHPLAHHRFAGMPGQCDVVGHALYFIMRRKCLNDRF